MALSETARLIASLELQDKFSPNVRKVESSLSRLEAGLGRTTKGVGQVGAGLGRIGLIAATAVGGGIVAATKLAGDFEAQLNTINTIAKLSESDLKAVGEGIRSTFRETGQPLADLTAGYYDLLSAGIKVTDAQEILNTSVKLGIGGLATSAEAVDLLTTAVNAYGLNASGATKAADIFAAAVRDGKVTVSEINASFADVAPLAAQFGITLEELGAAYAVLTARGVPAAEVGTQFNRSLIEGLKPGPQLIKVLDGLGASFEELIRKKGLVATLQDIREEAEKQQVPFQDLFGRIEAYKFALATTGPNNAAFIAELEKMGAASGEVNAQFSERQQGLNFQLGKLKALAQDAGITIGNALLPKIVPLIEKLNTFIQQNQGKIAEFGTKLADAFGNFADRAAKADFTGLIDGLKLLATVGQKVVDIFLSLPSGVQAALVAGVAVNKLSGGLIGSGIGNIAGGLIKLVFERGASPANPLWVQSVGGVPGGGGVAGTAGGGIIRSLLGVTTAVGLGAILGNAIGKSFFFNPTIQPAVDFETGQFERVAASQDLGRLNKGIEAIDAGLEDLKNADKQVVDLAGQQVRLGFLANFLTGEQTTLLEEQKRTLEQARDEIVAATGNASSASNAWSAKQLSAFDSLTAAQRVTASATQDTQSTARQTVDAVNEARGVIGRGFSELGEVVRSSFKIVSGAGKVVPPSVVAAGGGVVKLPDDLSSSLGEIATNTRPLAASLERLGAVTKGETDRLNRGLKAPLDNIATQASSWSSKQLSAFGSLTAAQRATASAAQAGLSTARQTTDAVNQARGAIGRGFSELGGVVRSSRANLRVQVNVTSSVSISETLRRITSARVATGTISQF